MSERRVYHNQGSVEDGAGSLDGNLLEMAKCVENAEVYVSACRNYLISSKRAIKDLEGIIIHAHSDITTAEDCIVESESRLQSLKQEILTILSKTFYKDADHATDASGKEDTDDTSSGSTADSKHPLLVELSGSVEKFAQESNLDQRNYNITFEKYDGLMFVIMKSKFVDQQRSRFSPEATSESDAHSVSPNDSLDNLKTDIRLSKRETRYPSARARGGTTNKTKHTFLPRVLVNDNAETDFAHNCSTYIPQKTMFRVKSEPRNGTGQSLSQSFLKAKFAGKQPLVPTEGERNGIDVRNDIFSNEICSSHSASHLKKGTNGSGSLVNVRYNLENRCSLSQNTVNDRGTTTTTLNQTFKDMFLNKDNRSTNTITNNCLQKRSQAELLEISNATSSMKLSEFNAKKLTSNLHIKPNASGSINMEHASNPRRNENRILNYKAKASNSQICKCCNGSASIQDETLNFSGTTSDYDVFKYGGTSFVARSTENLESENNTPTHSKTTLFKSVSENNLIDFSPKPLSQNFEDMSCYLETRKSFSDPFCHLIKYSNPKTRKVTENNHKQSSVISASANRGVNHEIFDKVIPKNDALSRFKSIDSLRLGDRQYCNKLRSCNSDNFLESSNNRLFFVPLNKEASSTNMQSNRASSLPRLYREFKKSTPPEFCQILDEETNSSDASEDDMLSPKIRRCYCLESQHFPEFCSSKDASPTVLHYGSKENGGNLTFETSSPELSDTLPLSFPDCQVFCGLTPGASESIRVQVSDLSMNNGSYLSMDESYGTVNSWQNVTEAPIQHESCPKNSTQTSYSVSEMSFEEPLEENLDERSTYQGTSESGFGSQNCTTASEPRSKIPPPGASESIRVQVSDLSMNNRSYLSMDESYGTVNSWQNVTEAPIQHESCPKNSTQTSYSVSEMSLEEPLEENLDERPTYQGTSESGFGSQNCTTASEPRSKSPPPRAFNPRVESCSSPVPDYSP